MRVWLFPAAAVAVAAVAFALAPDAARAAPVASIVQTGANPRLIAKDVDDDGVYDTATTLDVAIGADISVFCDDKVASPGGLVGLLEGGPDWTTGFFTFVYDENQIELALGLPNSGTTELPPAQRAEAIELCNAVPRKQVQRKSKLLANQFMGFLGVVGACVDGPSVELDTPVLDFLQDLFEDGIINFDSSGFGPPLEVALTPFGADVVCESLAEDDFAPKQKRVNVPLPDPKFTTPLKVTQAFLTAIPQTDDGKCGVMLSGVVVTDRPGIVRLAYENHLDIASGSFTVAVNQTLTAFFTRYFDFSTASSDLGLVTPTDDPAPGGSLAAETAFDYQGFFRMAGVSPAGWQSNNAEYAFDCEPPAPDFGIAVPGPDGDPPPPPGFTQR